MKDCCEVNSKPIIDPRYRKILWVALILNALMFFAEFASSFLAESVSLQADSIDFFGDAANYALSLYILASSVKVRAYASVAKGTTMGIFGIWVLSAVIYNLLTGSNPSSSTMTVMGALALFVNVSVAMMLYRYREGDSNMQSVWLCTRNDAIGNIAVILAAIGVYFTNSMWPDLAVGLIMGFLGVTSALQVLKIAQIELRVREPIVSGDAHNLKHQEEK